MDWWINFFRDMDSLEIARSSAWYGEDIELRAGNEPAIFGKEAATAALGHVLQQLQALRHDLGTVVTSGNDVFLECQVNYVFKDGRDVTVPAAAYFRRTDGAIRILHIFQHIPGLA